MRPCTNPLCEVENPEFYGGAVLCKKCHNKRTAELRRIRNQKKKNIDKGSTEDLRNLLREKDNEIMQLKAKLYDLTIK